MSQSKINIIDKIIIENGEEEVIVEPQSNDIIIIEDAPIIRTDMHWSLIKW